MEITYRGTPRADVTWSGTCKDCESKASATYSELTHVTHDQREGGSFSWEKCPVCSAGSDSGYGGMLFYPAK